MKRGLKLSVLTVSVLLLFSVSAHLEDEHENFSYEDFEDFYEHIPLINEDFQSEEIELPDSASFLVGDGNLLANLTDYSGKEFYLEIEDKQVTGISQGVPEKMNYIISTDEETVKSVLEQEDKLSEILLNYDEGNIELKAIGLGNKLKLFFTKIFVKFV